MWSDDDPRGMTDAWLARYAPQPRQGRPWVTLTFAQSQDGKIAGAQKQQLRLSGERSMSMTHRIRSMHDAILVGIGTMMADNPRLNGAYTNTNKSASRWVYRSLTTTHCSGSRSSYATDLPSHGRRTGLAPDSDGVPAIRA